MEGGLGARWVGEGEDGHLDESGDGTTHAITCVVLSPSCGGGGWQVRMAMGAAMAQGACRAIIKQGGVRARTRTRERERAGRRPGWARARTAMALAEQGRMRCIAHECR